MKINSEAIVLYNCPDTQGAILWRESEEGVLNEVNAVASALDTLGVVCRRHGVRRLDDVPTVLMRAIPATQEIPSSKIQIPRNRQIPIKTK